MSSPGQLLVWVALSFTKTAGLTSDEVAQFTTRSDYSEEYSGTNPHVAVETVDEHVLLIRFNAVPDHYTGQWDGQNNDFPLLKSQDLKIKIRKSPKRAHTVLWCLPFGMIGVTVKGVPIYNPYMPAKGCKYASDTIYLDACRGRTDKNGVYHYYDYSPCVKAFKCDRPGEIYGVAIDGYPIYGPYDEKGNLVTSRDLDECGGRLDEFGMYKYHIVMDQPNFMYCLKGQIHKDLATTLNIDNFVCNCPYMDSHFKAPKPECVKANSTGSEAETETKNAGDDIDSSGNEVETLSEQTNGDCMTPEELDERYTDSEWGGYNISRVDRVCNFTNPQNTVICKVDTTVWEERPSWIYRETVMPILPCCPSTDLKSCSLTCWVDRRMSKDNINPKCKKDKIEIVAKERVMVPNSSLCSYGGSWKYSGAILLSILGTLLHH